MMSSISMRPSSSTQSNGVARDAQDYDQWMEWACKQGRRRDRNGALLSARKKSAVDDDLIDSDYVDPLVSKHMTISSNNNNNNNSSNRNNNNQDSYSVAMEQLRIRKPTTRAVAASHSSYSSASSYTRCANLYSEHTRKQVQMHSTTNTTTTTTTTTQPQRPGPRFQGKNIADDVVATMRAYREEGYREPVSTIPARASRRRKGPGHTSSRRNNNKNRAENAMPAPAEEAHVCQRKPSFDSQEENDDIAAPPDLISATSTLVKQQEEILRQILREQNHDYEKSTFAFDQHQKMEKRSTGSLSKASSLSEGSSLARQSSNFSPPDDNDDNVERQTEITAELIREQEEILRQIQRDSSNRKNTTTCSTPSRQRFASPAHERVMEKRDKRFKQKLSTAAAAGTTTTTTGRASSPFVHKRMMERMDQRIQQKSSSRMIASNRASASPAHRRMLDKMDKGSKSNLSKVSLRPEESVLMDSSSSSSSLDEEAPTRTEMVDGCRVKVTSKTVVERALRRGQSLIGVKCDKCQATLMIPADTETMFCSICRSLTTVREAQRL